MAAWRSPGTVTGPAPAAGRLATMACTIRAIPEGEVHRVGEGADAPGAHEVALAPLGAVGAEGAGAGARQEPAQDVDHQGQAEPLVARPVRRADGEEAPVGRGHGVGGRSPLGVDRPAERDGLAPAPGVLELGPRRGGGGHVEDEMVAAGDRGGEGDRVGAEHRVGAAGGHGARQGGAQHHGHHPPVGGPTGEVAGRPEVTAVAHGHRPHPLGLGLGHRQVHGPAGDHRPEAAGPRSWWRCPGSR